MREPNLDSQKTISRRLPGIAGEGQVGGNANTMDPVAEDSRYDMWLKGGNL